VPHVWALKQLGTSNRIDGHREEYVRWVLALLLLKPSKENRDGMLGAERQLGEDKLLRADIESAAYVLPLNESTRALACISACNDGACLSDEATGRVKHSCELSNGSLFYGLGRRDGYPPRAA
jgi:hypothetical protein